MFQSGFGASIRLGDTTEPSMTKSLFAVLIVNRNITKELLSCIFTLLN